MITCWGENITEQWHVSYYVGTPDSMAAGGGGGGGGREGEGGGGGQEGICQEEGNTFTLLQCMWAYLTKRQGRGRGGGGGKQGEGEGKGEGGEEGEGEGEGEGRATRGSLSGIMHLWRRRRIHVRTTMEGRRGRGRGRVLQNLLIHNVYGHIHAVNGRRGGGGGE